MLTQKFHYDIRYSDELSEPFIRDFIAVHASVFGPVLTRARFDTKYVRNIYGRSVLAVVYDGNLPCAARAFWRNDLGGEPAWQPVDTCVDESHRGQGIFKEMTLRALSFLPEGARIYNFPNNNSRERYLKMGWKVLAQYHLRLFVNPSSYRAEHPEQVSPDYVNWWFLGVSRLRCVRLMGRWYVVRRLNKPRCYKILTEVSEPIFPMVRFVLCFYDSIKKPFYSKMSHSLYIIGRNVERYVPVWKMDAID